MRAPLVIPALLVLDSLVVARDFGSREIVTLAAVAAMAAICGRTQAHLLAACAVVFGLWLGTWRTFPAEINDEIATATVRGIVLSDVTSQPWGDSFELLGDDGRRYAIALRERVAIGEYLAVRGRMQPFDAPRNPGEPSIRELERERGVSGRLSEGTILSRAPPQAADPRTFAARVRASADARLHRLLVEPDATILAGMLYGARGALPPDLRAEFQDTGTVHILVTAGLHLGIVAAMLTFLLARLGFGRVGASLAAIPLLWCYAIVSGSHVPSLRAATMVTVALAARALGERALSLNALAVAAIVVAAIWPAWVGGASFGLSFSCVTAIVLFAEPISKALERCRVPAILREPLALTLSTQIGVWPLTAATFLVIAPYAALANLFVVPVAGVALIGGIAMLAAAPFSALAAVLARIEAWPLAWIESAVHLVTRLPFAHVVATPPPPWTIALYDCAMVAAGVFVRLRPRFQNDMNGHVEVKDEVLPSVAVRSLEALRVLVDSQRHQIVTLLMDAPLTAKDLAERLQLGRTRLYYHLDLLERNELIRVVETRVVSGITERRYRAVARHFRVDRALLSSEATGPQISETQAGIIEAVAADLRHEADPGDDQVLVARAFRRLTDERRRELRARMVAVLNEYDTDDPDGRPLEISMTLFARKESAT